jgi:hypothetical protein
MRTHRPLIARAALVAAVSAVALPTASTFAADTDVPGTTGGAGREYLVPTTGATALKAFTSADGNRGTYTLGLNELRIGNTLYTRPGIGQSQAFGQQIRNAPVSILEPENNDDRIVYGYHETGSINGINDLVRAQGLQPTANNVAITGSNPYFIMGQEANSVATLSTRYGGFLDAKPAPVISYSDVGANQAFGLSGAPAAFNSTPLTAGYGLAESSTNRGFIGHANPEVNFQALARADALDQAGDAYDAGLDTLANRVRNESLAVVPFTISANPGTGLGELDEADAKFLNLRGRLANGANFNYTTRDIGSGTRNQGGNNVNVDPTWAAGERDRVTLGAGPFNLSDRDGDTTTVTAGQEMRPGTDLVTGESGENPNEHRPSAIATFADKRSGSGALRPTVLGNRMGLGILSVGDVGSRGRQSNTGDPLRVLAIDFDENAAASGEFDAGAVQPTALAVTEGQYQLWSAAQAVTVVPVDANGNALTDGSIQGDIDDIADATNGAETGPGVARKFLTNITQSISDPQFNDVDNDGNLDPATPVAALIQQGFIPTQLMGVEKEFDGAPQEFRVRDAAAQQTFAQEISNPNGTLSQVLNWQDAATHNGNVSAQRYRGFDVANNSATRSPEGTVEIGFTNRTFLAGDLNNDGVRGLSDTESWADALANPDQFLADRLAAGDDIGAGTTVVDNSGQTDRGTLDISALDSAGKLALVPLTDLNGDFNVQVRDAAGNVQPKFLPDGSVNPAFAPALGADGSAADSVTPVSREDVRYFLYGASVDTTQSADGSETYASAADRRTLGVINGQLKKNEAISRFNARIDAIGGDAGLKFDPFDVNHDDLGDLADARLVNDAAGLDYRNIDDVLSTSTDLVAAEMTDDGAITFVSPSGSDQSDVERIIKGLAANDMFVEADANFDGTVNLGDFGNLRAGFGDPASNYRDGDFDFDGAVSLADFGILRANFGDSVGGPEMAPIFGEGADLQAFVNTGTGEIWLEGEGELAGFELESAAGLIDENAEILASGLDVLLQRDDLTAAGNLGGGIAVDGVLSLGNLWGGGTDIDLSVLLLGGDGQFYSPSLTAVPEPSAALATLGLAAGLLSRRRRK